MKKSKDLWNRKLNQEQRKFLQVMMIPLIVILLIIIILVAEHLQKEPEETQPDESSTAALEPRMTAAPVLDLDDWEERLPEEPGDEPDETQPDEESETETEEGETDAFETENFQRDGVPEILALIETYFQAREAGDAETMNRIYGIGEVPAQALEEQSARMRNNAKYVQEFENIATYVMDGADGSSWLVYAVADINFYFSKTRAPMIFNCYVTVDQEGNYTIMDQRNYTPEILRLIDEANHSEEVKKLAADVNGRMREALTSDQNLNNVYGVLREGSPVWGETGETEPEVVIGGQP